MNCIASVGDIGLWLIDYIGLGLVDDRGVGLIDDIIMYVYLEYILDFVIHWLFIRLTVYVYLYAELSTYSLCIKT